MNPKATGVVELRRRLLDATRECLRRDGLSGTSSRAIASTAGCNLQAITYHFASKDALVSEALLEAFRSWIGPAVAALRREADPVTRTLDAVRALQNSLDEAVDLLPVYLEALVQAPRRNPLRLGVEQELAELRRLMADQIEQMREANDLPRWVEPEPMAMLLLAAADGIALHAALEPEGFDAGAVAAQAIQLLLAARSE